MSLAKLLKHDRQSHTPHFKDYECRICEEPVTDINVHMKIHNPEKEFACAVCPMKFRHKNSLVRHMFQHTGERKCRCPYCESAFISMHRLKEHIEKRHVAEAATPHNLEDVSNALKEEERAEEVRLAVEKIYEETSEVEIVRERKVVAGKKRKKKSNPSAIIMNATTTPTTTSTLPLMSMVQGSNGQMFLLPVIQQPQQLLFQPTTTIQLTAPEINVAPTSNDIVTSALLASDVLTENDLYLTNTSF